MAGASLALSHLIFVPFVLPHISALVSNDRSKGRPTTVLEKWLSVHWVRTWTVDVVAWACLVVGVARNVSV